MYDRDRTTILDNREMLRVKVKTLAAEARIIRHEELKTHGLMREKLHLHRVGSLRMEARHTHLAYGFIKGRTFEQMEGKRRDTTREPSWTSIRRMVSIYGSAAQLASWDNFMLELANAKTPEVVDEPVAA